MAQKTRRQLQDLFKQGAKPSGDDFSDFVESTFNIKDDGLEKPVGADAPLKIISYGAEENLLDFYTDDSHSWRLNQKPSAAETAGLNFENSAGSSKLFIASSSGNVGISSTNPKARLHILQSGNADALRIDDAENDTKPILIDKDGKVGIGTTSPGATLEVDGDIKYSEKLSKLDVAENHSATIRAQDLLFGHSARRGDLGRALVDNTDALYLNYDGDWGNTYIGGNVGIGTTTPRTALDMGTGVMSGAPNDYLKAQFMMSRGGTVTWKNFTSGSATGMRLKWTLPFRAISMERQTTFSNGFLDITQPLSDIPAENVYDGQARSVTNNGVRLNVYEALYAVHTVGGRHTAISFQIKLYTYSFYAPSNWLLVAVVGDGNIVKLGTGVFISLNSSHSNSSPIPVGTIVMWSGALNAIPGGWAVCDGTSGTPDLRNRFLVGAGDSYSVNNTGGSKYVTLNTSQMPSHNHSATTNTTGSHSHRMEYDTGGGGNQGSGNMPKTGYTPNALANFALNSKSNGSHSHTVRIGNKGGNRSHENRPPYYAVYFIMKL